MLRKLIYKTLAFYIMNSVKSMSITSFAYLWISMRSISCKRTETCVVQPNILDTFKHFADTEMKMVPK